jgi:hypothetical protein
VDLTAAAAAPADAATAHAEGRHTRIAGRWTMEIPGLGDSPSYKDQKFEITIAPDRNRYSLAVDSKTLRFPYLSIACYDGEDTFSAAYPRTWASEGDLYTPRVSDTNHVALGKVVAGSFPEKRTTAEQLLWIAYVSSPDLPFRAPCQFPLTCFDEYENAEAKDFWMETHRVPEATNLLAQIRFYAPGSGTNKEGVRYRFPPPYDQGWVQATYTVDHWTNTAAGTLPLEFTFKTYIEKQAGDPKDRDDADVFQIWRFRAEAFDATQEPPLALPPVPEKSRLLVNDYRIVSFDGSPFGFQHGLNGAFWPRGSTEFRAATEAAAREHSAIQRGRLLFPLFLVVLAGPLCWLIWKGTAAQRKQANI